MHRTVSSRCAQIHALVLLFLASTGIVFAQTQPAPEKPYATLDRNAVAYDGPGRAKADDLPGKTVTIGIVVPQRGPEANEGKAMLAAAQIALVDAMSQHPSLHLRLAVGDETGQWGRVSNEIVRLLFQEESVALVTSANGNTAHQAEQIANKIGVPVLTLSGDSTTTEINLPWIFRLVPSDADQAQVIAARIYRTQHPQRVVFIYEDDHDGRIGLREFRKIVERLHQPAPVEIKISSPASASQLKTLQFSDAGSNDLRALASEIQARKPQAIVFWTSAPIAKKLTSLMQTTGSAVPLYLCRRAADILALPLATAPVSNVWTIFSPATEKNLDRTDFSNRYYARTGEVPIFAAAETYNAVHLIATALLQSGPNRARLRDALHHAVISIPFDSAGNLQSAFAAKEIN